METNKEIKFDRYHFSLVYVDIMSKSKKLKEKNNTKKDLTPIFNKTYYWADFDPQTTCQEKK